MNFQTHTSLGIPYKQMLLLDGVSKVEGLGVQIIKRSVREDDGK